MLDKVNGYKVYISCIVGILVILGHQYLGLNVPGVQFDDANWLNDIYQLALLMAGRSAMPDKKGIIS